MRLRFFSYASVGAVALLLGACASTHGIKADAQLRAVDSLQSGRSLAGAPLTKAAWPATNWWTQWGDPQLDQLIAAALKHNPDVAIAQARAQQADARAGVVAAGLRPTLGASASFSGARLPESIVPAPLGGDFNWLKYGLLKFNWTLDLWGGERASWEAAVDQAHAAQVDSRAAQLTLAVGVARAYAQLGYAIKQQQLMQEELTRAQQAHDLTQQRVTAGIDGKLQLKRAEAEVATAKRELAVGTRGVASARIALAVLLGAGPDRGLSIAAPHLVLPAEVALPPKLPAKLLVRRPDLVAARWRVEAAGQGIKSAKAKFLPDISIGAMAGLAAKGDATLFNSAASFYQLAPSVSLPIFHGGDLRANLAGKSAGWNLAVANYNKVLIGALNQVANYKQGLQSLALQAAAQQQALDAAQQAWQLSQLRYKAGVGSFLESLGVRQQLLAAEQGAAALHAQQVDLSLQLVAALGGGFTADAAARDLTQASSREPTKEISDDR